MGKGGLFTDQSDHHCRTMMNESGLGNRRDRRGSRERFLF